MFFNTLLATVAVATAFAAPTDEHHGDVHNVHTGKITTLGDAAAQCGNHQELHCCNKGDETTGNGVLSGVLGHVLDGSCSPIDITVLGINFPISSACTNQVACCTGNQNGLVNLACTNLNL